jgi:hypothetical protein
MRRLLPLFALALVGAGASLACTITTINGGDDGGVDGAVGPEAATDDGSTAAEGSVGSDGGVEAEAEAAAPQTFIRVANWSPDAPAAGFDICLAPHGTTVWSGPMLAAGLAGTTALADGGASAIQFPWVTASISVNVNQYDLQLVAAGAATCATGFIPTTVNLPALAAGATTTFAIIGDVSKSGADASLSVVAFANDSTVASGNAALRFINVAPDLAAVDVGDGTLSTSNFQPLFTNVQFGQSGTQAGSDAGTVDANGYVEVAPVSGVKLSVHTSAGGTSDTATASNQILASGVVTTMALVGGKNGGPSPQLLVCADNGTPSGGFTPCSIVTQ